MRAEIFRRLNRLAHAVLVGVGLKYDIIRQFYVDVSGEMGAAFVRSEGIHDANLFPQLFPAAWNANFAAGGTLKFGYQITDGIALTLSSGYYSLGQAATGITCHCIPGTPDEHAQERLRSNMNIIPIMLGIRFSM